MSTPSNIQVVHDAANKLLDKFTAIQKDAITPGSTLYNYAQFHTCHRTFVDTIKKIHETIRDGYTTADFMLKNVFTKVQDPTVGIDAKMVALTDFRNAINHKRQGLADPRGRVQGFRGLFTTPQSNLILANHNPTAINNQLVTVEGGLTTVDKMYTEINQLINKIEVQLGQGNITTAAFASDIKWLATISADLKTFNPRV